MTVTVEIAKERVVAESPVHGVLVLAALLIAERDLELLHAYCAKIEGQLAELRASAPRAR